MRTVGVDLAAEPDNTASATLDWGPGGATVTQLVVGCTDEQILAAAAGAAKVGIDCPFGWPLPFHRLLTEHHSGHVLAPEAVAPKAWRRTLAMRTTDLAIWRAHGSRPLSVAADLIAYPAMRCAGLLGRLGAAGHDVRRDGSGRVVETYPAASLKRWELPYRGYKGLRGAPGRHELVTELVRRAQWLDLGPFDEQCRASDHALDAVVAALTARAAALGLTHGPDPEHADAAAVEGWIHVPKVALEQLSPERPAWRAVFLRPGRISPDPSGHQIRRAPPTATANTASPPSPGAWSATLNAVGVRAVAADVRRPIHERERETVVDVDAALDAAGLKNGYVREYVKYWAEHTGVASVEVVSAADDSRLIAEALAAGELEPAGEQLYYSRSYYKDTARSEERTIVATASERDRGTYNNWRPSAEMIKIQKDRMRGASAGKTMYVIPYLMSQPGSPLERFAAGVELTDCRPVVLHMIRMARVGAEYLDGLADQNSFVRAVHVTGDLEHLGQGTENDQRYFVTVADERTILHFGSSYGGNALLGKIAHGLRQASYDGWASGEFLSEQFMLIGITDKQTGRKYHICGGFPSASGKTNLAMMLAPDDLGERYHVEFYGDDIAWLWVDQNDGKLYALNPEYGVFGVAKDTNETTNPTALGSIQPGSGAIFTNVAYNPTTQQVWWEGRTPSPPADVHGWLDWKGTPIADREREGEPWAHPNSRFTTTLSKVPNIASDFEDPKGVPIDAIIFGGRTRDREPLIRAITDLAEGVYDGLTLGAEATFAAEGVEGQLRYDPMSMRPFMSYPEADYAAHWLKIIGSATEKPIFAHVNWFQRGPDGHFLWPGYRDNLRPLLWLLALKNGEVTGRQTPVGILPTADELDLSGVELQPGDLDKLLSIDVARWRQEMGFREKHLEQFAGLPEEIWEAHRRVAAALDAAAE